MTTAGPAAIMSSPSPNRPLVEFPAEIIIEIIKYLEPRDVLAFRLVSRRFFNLTEDRLLWKGLCRTNFKYWSSDYKDRRKGSYSYCISVSWKQVLLSRLRINAELEKLFQPSIETDRVIIRNIARICKYGLNAKDFLLQQCRLSIDHPEALYRQWLANRTLNCMHRSMAMAEWWDYVTFRNLTEARLGQGYKKGRLERAVGAFDMFLFQQEEGDIDLMRAGLDDMASQFRRKHQDYLQKSIHSRALLLLRWVNSLYTLSETSPSDEAEVETVDTTIDIAKSLLGRAVLYGSTDMYPHVVQTVFIALAQRLDIPAYLCNTPTFVIIPRTPGEFAYYMDCDLHLKDRRMPLFIRPGLSNHPEEFCGRLEPRLEDVLVNEYLDIFRRYHLGVRMAAYPLPDFLYSSVTPTRLRDDLWDTVGYMLSCFKLLQATPSDYHWINLPLSLRSPWIEDNWITINYLQAVAAKLVYANPALTPQRVIPYLPDLTGGDAVISRARQPCYIHDGPLRPRFRIGDVVERQERGEMGIVLDRNDKILYCFVIGNLSRNTPNHDTWHEDSVTHVYNSDRVLTAPSFPAAGKFFKRFNRTICRFESDFCQQCMNAWR